MWSHLVRKTYLDKIPTKFVTWKGEKCNYFTRTWQALTFPLFARRNIGLMLSHPYLWWMKEKFLILNLTRKCGIFYWATDGENVQNVDFEWTKMEKKAHMKQMKQGTLTFFFSTEPWQSHQLFSTNINVSVQKRVPVCKYSSDNCLNLFSNVPNLASQLYISNNNYFLSS